VTAVSLYAYLAVSSRNAAILEEQTKALPLAEKRPGQSVAAVGLFVTGARKFRDDALVPGKTRDELDTVLIDPLEKQRRSRSNWLGCASSRAGGQLRLVVTAAPTRHALTTGLRAERTMGQSSTRDPLGLDAR